ncbi:MAG: VCBS domain-containing protein, partial [Alphaproteobacteria bacterium]
MGLFPRLPKLVIVSDVETSHTVNTGLDTTEARLANPWPFYTVPNLLADTAASAFKTFGTLQRVTLWPFASLEENLGQLNLLTGHVFPTLPVLEDDVYEVPETDSGNILTLDVLANDRDDNVLNNVSPLLGPEMIIREIDLTGFTLGDVTIAEDGQSLVYQALEGVVLGPGQSLEETFTYSVTNLTGRTSTAEVTITIFNVNEAPIAEDIVQIITENIPAIVVEAVFSDGDPGDQHVISLNPAGTDTTQGNVSQNPDGSFSYDPGTAFDYLAVGEEATDSFTYQVEDLEGATDTATVTLTLTGENDAVELTPGAGTIVSADVIEFSDADGSAENSVTQTRAGQIFFGDADVTDTHTARFSPAASSGYLGGFAISAPTTTNSTTQGQVGWTFAVADGGLDFLREGETRQQFYDVVIADGHGGDLTQQVEVTITGTNDAVGILGSHVSDLTGSATEVADEAAGENTQIHNITGTVLFSDVDLADGHTVTLTPLDSTAGNFVGAMGAPTLTRAAGDVQGKVDWSYEVNDALLDSLGVNDTIVERFTLTIMDDATNQSIATEIIELTLQGVNDTPTLVNGAAAAAEDGDTIQIDLAALGDDADAEDNGSTLGYAISQGPPEGQGSITGTTLTFDPGADFQDLALDETRDVIIGLTATDAQGAVSDVNTITITVAGVNDAPTLIDGATSGLENEGLNLDLAALGDDVDSDNDGGDLTYEIVGAPEYGNASITGTSLSLDQGTDFDDLATGEARQVTVEVQATDRHGAVSTTQSVIFTVTGVNDAPIIVEADQADTITETASGGGVADGPDEPDDSTANADNTGDNFPPDGGVGGGLDGGLPAGGGQTGVHTAMGAFTFTDVDASDDHTIEVTALGDDAANDVGALVVSPAAIASGEVKAFEWTFEVAETAINAMAAGDQRVQTYEVKVTDSANPGLSDTRIVTITIDGRNDAPIVAGALSAAATENGAPVSINLFEGATDPDNGAVLSIADLQVEGIDDFGQTPGISYDAASGVLSLNPYQTAYESLNAGEVHDITATYSVADEHGAKRAQTATFVLTGVNDAPGAMDALFATDEASAVRSSASSLGFDVDAQNSGNNLDYEILQGPAKGLASFPADPANGDRDFLFDPNGQFEYLGVNQFEDVTVTYRAIDDHNATSPTAAITIRVHGVNDEATIRGTNTGVVVEDGTRQVIQTLTVSDVDDNEARFIQPGSGDLVGTYGTFRFDETLSAGTWSWSYKLDNDADHVQELGANDTRTDTLTVTSLDGTASETITVTINGANDGPVAVDDVRTAINIIEDSGATFSYINLLDNDTDVDGDTLSVIGFDATSTEGAALSVFGGNTIRYDPTQVAGLQALAAGETMDDSFTYTISDGNGGEDTATVTLAVHGVNDAATFGGTNTGAVTEDGDADDDENTAQFVQGSILVADADHDQSALTPQTDAAGDGGYGVFSVAANGDWTYTLDNAHADVQALGVNDSLTDTLAITSVDGTQHSITVTINGANDGPVAVDDV